jgi:hypothetical protein
VIEAGKGHFVAVAESKEPVEMIVISPKMDAAQRMVLAEAVEGTLIKSFNSCNN